ncbi:hypothetical protein RAMLITH_02995 [Ramlibacter sp. RBP-2]|uniref:Uncharacterized protein n=1 Tax=Ramlibacter lithotrophicus TaxID=2606681 RepID=A0A7X6I501_9BURK|nr:hypothetical protein [Ramlibacter lithotrophicus]NKE64776.1 hypothetical protein [Ramlibacter lithotrophicus]
MALKVKRAVDPAVAKKLEARRLAVRTITEKNAKNALSGAELRRLEDYLRSPVSVGFWRLTVKRRFDGKLLSYLAPFYGVTTDIEEAIRGEADGESPAELKKISTCMKAITAGTLYHQHGAADEQALLNHGHTGKEPFDPEQVAQQFPETVELFRDRIYFPDYLANVTAERPYRLKSGYVLIHGPWNSDHVTFVSDKQEPLTDLGAFLSSAELGDCEVEKIFSPEDELFAPYFLFLQITFDDLIKDARIKSGLKIAFDYFVKNDFTHCISSLGLLAEDYLTQVYEYYFRMPGGKGSTLGQLYEQIHSKLRELTQPPSPKLGDADAVYKAISTLKTLREAADNAYSSHLESVLRDVISLVKADRKCYTSKIDGISKPGRKSSLFPPMLNDDLLELIRYRNAASHKSRVPLGSFEALRTLYCLTTFVLWWHDARSQTDWSLNREEILNLTIAKASTT